MKTCLKMVRSYSAGCEIGFHNQHFHPSYVTWLIITEKPKNDWLISNTCPESGLLTINIYQNRTRCVTHGASDLMRNYGLRITDIIFNIPINVIIISLQLGFILVITLVIIIIVIVMVIISLQLGFMKTRVVGGVGGLFTPPSNQIWLLDVLTLVSSSSTSMICDEQKQSLIVTNIWITDIDIE